MSELPPYAQQTKNAQLRNWVLSEMMRGAGWAALVLIACVLFVYVWVVVSWALPENPYAALETAARTMLT
jgi:hypothetical protein